EGVTGSASLHVAGRGRVSRSGPARGNHPALRHRQWGPREIGMLGVGVVIGGILIGFLAPLPPGVTATAKLTQNAALLLAAVLLAFLTSRRTRQVHDGAPELRR